MGPCYLESILFNIRKAILRKCPEIDEWISKMQDVRENLSIKEKVEELERGFSSYKHWLLFEKTGFQFPSPTK